MKSISLALFLVLLLVTCLDIRHKDSIPESASLQASRTLSSINDSKQIIGQIIKLQGNAFIQREIRIEVYEKMNLYEKDTITTLDKSFVKIQLVDKSTFSLGSNSTSKLTEFEMTQPNERNVTIDLIKGMMRSHFIVKNKKGEMKVRTTSAVMGVRGTEFINTVNLDSTELILIEGSVSVTRLSDNRTLLVNPEEKLIIHSNVELKATPISKEELVNYMNHLTSSFTPPEHGLASDVVNQSNLQEVIAANDKTPDFEEAMNNVESYKKEDLQKIISSPKLSVKEKKDLIDASPVQNKTALIKDLHNIDKNDKYNKIMQKLIDPALSENLSPETKEKFTNLGIKVTLKQTQDFIDNGLAAVLITPDNKVVFFEDHPGLKAQLPTDSNGDVLGIKVDENLVPVNNLPLINAAVGSLSLIQEKSIPVINDLGEVTYLPILNEVDQSAIIPPTLATGSAAGINPKIVESTLLGKVIDPTLDLTTESLDTASTDLKAATEPLTAPILDTGLKLLRR